MVYQNKQAKVVGTPTKYGQHGTPKKIFQQAGAGDRKKGKPRAKFKDQVEGNLRALGTINWKTNAKNREEWKLIIEQAKNPPELVAPVMIMNRIVIGIFDPVQGRPSPP